MSTLQGWHIVSGDWRVLDDDRRRRFWPFVADRIRVALEFEIEAGQVEIDALELPFYRGRRTDAEGQPTENGEFVYELIQVGLPVDIDFVGLKRWCFFLWDGEADLVALDGLSSTIHAFNRKAGIALADRDPAVCRARAAMYLEFFCAFLLAENKREEAAGRFGSYFSPFLPIAGKTSFAWVEDAAAAATAFADGPGSPYPTLRDDRPFAQALDVVDAFAGDTVTAAEPGTPVAPKKVFRSADVEDAARSLLLLFGRTLARARVELVFDDLDVDRWRSASVRMIGEDGGVVLDGLPPLFVRAWHRRIAFFCARAGVPLADAVAIRPSRFAALLRNRHFVDASRGLPSAFTALVETCDEAGRTVALETLRLLATRHWGGPLGTSRIRVLGDLELAAPGDEVATQIDLDGPVHVEGHLVFAGATFLSPARMVGWRVDGRIDGAGARAMRTLALRFFRVVNGIGTIAPNGAVDYPDNGVKLDELRVTGSLDLEGLDLDGGIALRRAHIGGRLMLEDARLNPHLDGAKPGRLAAEHAVVGGSLEAVRLQASGPVQLSNARVGGDVDLSGALVLVEHVNGIEAKSLHVDGDLFINRYQFMTRAETQPEDLSPTLIGGGINAENARVTGSVFACHCHVLGDMDFRGANIGHNVTIYGLHGARTLPAAARATIVQGELSLYDARVGGCINLDGTVCQQIEFNFLHAAAVFVYPGSGSGLPLAVLPAENAASSGAGTRECMYMSYARIGGVFAQGVQLGGGVRAINTRVEGDFQMNAAQGVAAEVAKALSAEAGLFGFAARISRGIASELRGASDRSGRVVAGKVFAREVDALGRVADPADDPAGDTGPGDCPAALPTAIEGDLRLDGLVCGGIVNLTAIRVRLLGLDGARVANRFTLGERSLPGSSEAAPRARISGGLRLRNAVIGGTACLAHADVTGSLDVSDSELTGEFTIVDCRFEPPGDSGPAVRGSVPEAPAGLRINNVRTRSDLRLIEFTAQRCEIRDSAIGGDLVFGRDSESGQRRAPSDSGSQAMLASLRIVADRIEGGITLDRLDVEGDVDLTDTRANRGLRVGDGMTCRTFDLTRFETDADVDLQRLVLDRTVASAAPEATQCGAARSSGTRPSETRGRLLRYRDDLLSSDEASTVRARGVIARHSKIGGVFRLPQSHDALRCADLAFSVADRLELAGAAFAESVDGPDRTPSGLEAVEIALDLRGSRFDSASLTQPLPRRVDLRESVVANWDIKPASDQGASAAGEPSSSSSTYLDFVHRSWPYTQAAYTKLEQDYRDGGQHKDADYFLVAAGWRTWRWSMIRPAFEGWGARLLLLAAALCAGLAGLRFGWGWGAVTLVLAGTVYALLSPIDVFKRASRALIGLFVVAPFQLLYGFGIRWWLPLVLSVALLFLVTVPVLSDCRNLQSVEGGASVSAIRQMDPPAGQARKASLLATLGAETDAGPAVVASCVVGPQATSESRQPVRWDLGEALWLALRYHLPVVPLDTFFHGERSESVRPSAGPLHLDWGMPGGKRLVATLDRVSPIAYARAVYLLSWLVIPFSLIFAAARIQRKFRLQKD